MRARPLIAATLLTVSLVLGCSAPTPGTDPFTLPALTVVGLESPSDVEFIGLDEGTGALLATGIYRAATQRFTPAFLSAPAIPAAALTPFSLDEEACVATIAPTTLRTATLSFFLRDGAGGLLVLTNVDDLDDVAEGARVYEFWLAPTGGSVFGTCTSDRDAGFTVTYTLELEAGWNAVARVVTAVDGGGLATALRYRTEAPIAGTAWRYVAITGSGAADAWPARDRRVDGGR